MLLAAVERADNPEASKLPYSSLTVVGVPTVEAVEVNGLPLDQASWSHRDGTLQVSCDVSRVSLGQALLLAWKHSSSEVA